jgi:hypothetical protein
MSAFDRGSFGAAFDVFAHPRMLIRHAIVALLLNATAAAARVYTSRVDPLRKGSLPAISVYILSEEIKQDVSSAAAPREIERVANVELAGFVGGGDEQAVTDAMDDLSKQIEDVMDADPYLGGEAADSILDKINLEIRAEDGHSDPLVGVAVLTYSVTYRTSPATPAELDDFVTVSQSTEIGGVPDTIPTSDQFTVQEIL